MMTKREVLKRFAETGYCTNIDCSECAYKEMCDTDKRLTITVRLQKIGAMAILRMFPKKKKPILKVGTKIKFSDGKTATISKVDYGNVYYYTLVFGNGQKEYFDYLIGKVWEIVE